ncbi:unnamed protein product [Cutaneotrichosporon oleaginosum]
MSPKNLTLPKLIITPPSREPTPQLIIVPADWERYPGITFAVPVPAPQPPRAHAHHQRPPAYRPPAPPVEQFDLPTPTSEKRWHVSGRARGAGWATSETSLIHDAADDAYMAAFGEALFDFYAEEKSGRISLEKAEYDYSEEKEGCRDAAPYAAYTSAYARAGEAGAWRQRQRRGSRPPPPVKPLDLPGSGARAVAPGNPETKRPRRSSWWSLGKR